MLKLGIFTVMVIWCGWCAQAWKGRTGLLWSISTAGLGCVWWLFVAFLWPLVLDRAALEPNFDPAMLELAQIIIVFGPVWLLIWLAIASLPARRPDQELPRRENKA